MLFSYDPHDNPSVFAFHRTQRFIYEKTGLSIGKLIFSIV